MPLSNDKEETVGIRQSRSPTECERESDGVIVLMNPETTKLWGGKDACCEGFGRRDGRAKCES